jgi:hypothetical protein
MWYPDPFCFKIMDPRIQGSVYTKTFLFETVPRTPFIAQEAAAALLLASLCHPTLAVRRSPWGRPRVADPHPRPAPAPTTRPPSPPASIRPTSSSRHQDELLPKKVRESLHFWNRKFFQVNPGFSDTGWNFSRRNFP